MARKQRTKNISLDWFGDEIAATVKQHEEAGLWAMGSVILEDAQGRAPRDSGRLRASGFLMSTKRTTHHKQKGDRRRMPQPRAGTVLVGFAAWYSNLYEDSGVKRHAIPYVGRSGRARKRKVLQIEGLGYRSAVMHPGVKRRPFLAPAVDASKDEGAEAFAKLVRGKLEREQ